ncbi:MAG TPA: xanthine dehydrogenase family protein subunit M [Anaerolineales bacterium]|nr:xanthine dehydrogenase family protein subunit M [Anaerolineales bacterium]
MKDVQYYAPDTLKDALRLLGKHGARIRVLAGGTDLVRNMNLEFTVPDNILWIGKLGLEYIRRDEGLLHIGAATRMQTAGASKLLQDKATALAQAAGKMAAPPVRSLATLGGNICNASPAADSVCAMIALGAEIVLTSARGSRVVALDKFFTGPGKTVMKPGEMLTEIRIRPTAKGEGSAYAKVGRRQALTLAVLNAAARVRLDGHGACADVRIAIGAAAPTPVRAVRAEALLRGQPFTHEAIARAAEQAVAEIHPIDDVHGTAWYRRKLTRVLVARVLARAGGLGEGA